MFLGHYAPAFLAKAVDRRIPLWLLFLAAQFLDLVWDGLVLLGIEKASVVPGITRSNPLDLFFMPYSHSLVAAVTWSSVVFVVCLKLPGLPGNRRAAFVVALVVLSHWLLDLPVHRQDLAIYDNALKQGFGLWDFPAFSFLLEVVLLGGAAWWYYRSAHRLGPAPSPATWILVGVMLLLQAVVAFGPQPTSVEQVVWFALGVYGAATVGAALVELRRVPP